MSDTIGKFVVEHLVDPFSAVMLPGMILLFVAGVVVRCLIYYTVRAEGRFSREFEKRTQKYFVETAPESRAHSFHRLTKALLEKTYEETFNLRNKYKRRNIDYVMSAADRLFLIQDGVYRLVVDTLKRTRYLRKDGHPPKLMDLAKATFDNNPVFTRLLGIFPMGIFNEFLNILPGLFVILGIFGTFLGVMRGLPDLGGMDLANAEETKRIMDLFLTRISHSMLASVMGIGLSVLMTLVNTALSPESVYYGLINRFTGALEFIWNETSTNEVDAQKDILHGERTKLMMAQAQAQTQTPPKPPGSAPAA
jgi:hypothetical protein